MPQSATINRRIVVKAMPRDAPTSEDRRADHDPGSSPAGPVAAALPVPVDGALNAR